MVKFLIVKIKLNKKDVVEEERFYKLYKTNNTKSDCILRLMNEHANTSSYLVCGKYCPLECDSLNYQIVSNFIDFPVDGQMILHLMILKSLILTKRLKATILLL